MSKSCAGYLKRIGKFICNKNKISMTNPISKDVFEKSTCIVNQLNPEKIFASFNKFGIEEYKQLSEAQKNILRKNTPVEIIEKAKVAINLSKPIKAHFDKLYPDGYTLVAIGRSPAVLGKALEHQGVPVKYCPISDMGRKIEDFSFVDVISSLPSEKVLAYKKYLDSIGITQKALESSKTPFIFADYCATGDSLKNFQLLLERPEIGIKGVNVRYEQIKPNLYNSNEVKPFIDNIAMSAFKDLNLPHYSSLSYKNLNKIESVINQPYSDNCKKLQFELIEHFNSIQK